MEKQLKILVVEDDKYIANFIAVSLEKDGYSLLCAQSADEGLFLFASHRPDIVLLDLGLPDKDGLEVIKAIRDTWMCRLGCIRKRAEKEKIEALDLGANDYITKPFFIWRTHGQNSGR
jgi:two-component system KDP operon response regulator KdpE